MSGRCLQEDIERTEQRRQRERAAEAERAMREAVNNMGPDDGLHTDNLTGRQFYVTGGEVRPSGVLHVADASVFQSAQLNQRHQEMEQRFRRHQAALQQRSPVGKLFEDMEKEEEMRQQRMEARYESISKALSPPSPMKKASSALRKALAGGPFAGLLDNG